LNKALHAVLAATAALAVVAFAVPVAKAAAYNFQTLNNPGDPAFNQLLGINTAGTIAGYFGDGNVLPNKGYTLAAPYTPGSYTNENFPGSAQTQVVGINNGATPTTVGFWVDGNGNNFGFVDQNGTFTSVSDPNTPAMVTPTTNQLLGVNDNNIAAGFYVDGAGDANGFLYNIQSQTFTPITLPSGFNAMSVTATGINDNGVVSGFYVDTNGATHGFIDNNGTFTSFDDPNTTMNETAAQNTMFLGLNNNNYIVGSYLDAGGVTDGLVYNLNSNTWLTVNDPNNSATPAFNVTGTTINGINNQGSLVGFYSDGTNVDGFLASVPEPASFGMAGLGAALIAAGLFRKKRTNS
jgi:hypothetical protein